MHNYSTLFNFALWTSAVFYSIYKFSTSANLYFKYYEDVYHDFCDSQFIKFRKKDCSDHEWESILRGLYEGWIGFTLHLMISEVLRTNSFSQGVQYWHIFSFFLFVTPEIGSRGTFIIFVIIFAYRLAGTFHKKCYSWLTTFLVLLILNTAELVLQKDFILQTLNLDYIVYQDLMVAAHWSVLKCLSYNIDIKTSKKQPKTLDLLSYCLYLPLFFFGPFITFADIKKSYLKSSLRLSKKIVKLLKSVARFCFWLAFAEFFLHFTYVNATVYHPYFVETLDYWSLYGYGYTMGQFFHIKYVVMYGIATALAEFENVPIPKIPRCIGRVHLYSDMWRHFDTGLYTFLTKYIYVPTMNNNRHFSKILSSLLCFVFVYVWHGTQICILIWSCLNFAGLTLEMAFKSRVAKQGLKYFDPKWKRRVVCCFATPLLAMSAISNFYFFAGTEIGNIFVKRFFQGNLFTNCVLFFFLYQCCQVSTELKLKEK